MQYGMKRGSFRFRQRPIKASSLPHVQKPRMFIFGCVVFFFFPSPRSFRSDTGILLMMTVPWRLRGFLLFLIRSLLWTVRRQTTFQFINPPAIDANTTNPVYAVGSYLNIQWVSSEMDYIAMRNGPPAVDGR